MKKSTLKTTQITVLLILFISLGSHLLAAVLVPNNKVNTVAKTNRPVKSFEAIKASIVKKELPVSVANKHKAFKLKARITKYNDHKNKMANCCWPKPGYVAVSDRSIKLGSSVWINSKRYIVGDYTAKWVHQKSLNSGYDLTVDIFTTENTKDCLKFGVKQEKVVLKKV